MRVNRIAAEHITRMIGDAEYRVHAAERNPAMADGADGGHIISRALDELNAARIVRAELILVRDRILAGVE